MKTLCKVFLICISFAVWISCTRNIDGEAKLSLNLNSGNAGPSASSTCSPAVPAGMVPAHLVANVHYDGKIDKVEWDCEGLKNGNLNGCHFPPSISFPKDLPPGENRIVQVLLVYASETGSMKFYYGDQLNVQLTSGVNDVVINCWDTGSGNEVASMASESMVSGRIVDEDGNGITGEVKGLWQPTNGAPAMELFDSGVFDGWFQFMFLNGPRFTWKVGKSLNPAHEGKVLFDNKNLGDIYNQITATTDAHAAIIAIPDMWRVHSTNQQSVFISGAPSTESTMGTCASFPCAFGGTTLVGNGDLGDNSATNGVTINPAGGQGVIFDLGQAETITGVELHIDSGAAWSTGSGFSIKAMPSGNSEVSASSLYDGAINIGNTGFTQEYFDFYQVNYDPKRYLKIEFPSLAGARLLADVRVQIQKYEADRSPESLQIVGFFETTNGGQVKLETGLLGSPSLSRLNYNDSTGGNLNEVVNTSVYPSTSPVDGNGVWMNKMADTTSNGVSWGGLGSTPDPVAVKVLNSSAPYNACGADVSDLMMPNNCIWLAEEMAEQRSMAPFAGPFKMFKVSNSDNRIGELKVMTANNGNGRKIRWKYIPNLVTNNIISGAYAFIVDRTELENFRDGEYDFPCTAMLKSQGVNVISNDSENDPFPNIYDSRNIAAIEGQASEALFNTIPGGTNNKDILVCPYANTGSQVVSYNMGIHAHGINHSSSAESTLMATVNTYNVTQIDTEAKADAVCQTEGDSQSITSGKTWKALLSRSSINASNIFTNNVEFINIYGSYIADKQDFFSGITLTQSFSVFDPAGNDRNTTAAWTGSDGSGNYVGGTSCLDWTDSTAGNNGHIGIFGNGANRFTIGSYPCSNSARLYCASVPD